MEGPDIFVINLTNATEQPGCPVCNIGVAAEQRYMRHFLHEYVNDIEARKKLYKSWGFCNRHAWQLQELEVNEYKDGLKNAILYEWMLARAIKETKEAIIKLNQNVKQSAFWFKNEPARITEALQRQQICPICQVSIESQNFHLELLVKNLNETGYLECYKASDGLCLQHFIQALDIPLEKELLVKLCDMQIKKLGNIHQDIKSYIEKHDYQNQDEYTKDEQSAYIKAVAFMAGRPK